VRRRVVRASGGPARAIVIVLLGAALGLESADTSTIGAVAPQLQRALGIGHAQVGLLLSVSLGVGALATVPVGVLVDRLTRTRLLAGATAIWSLALVACGAASSYGMLIAFRLALGVISAVAWPAVASLTGDFFFPRERGRVYGLILTGELLGTGVGFAVSGNVAAALGWRAAFWVLALPGFALAWALWRRLPEPLRGGRSRLSPGSRDFVRPAAAGTPEAAAPAEREDDLVGAAIRNEGISPRDEPFLKRDPRSMSLWQSTRFILRIRTNVVLIIAGSVSYFFYAGIQTFGTEFMRSRFGLGQSAATTLLVVLGAGALLGVMAGGRLADRLIGRGHINGRVTVPAAAFLLSAILFLPALLTRSLLIASPLLFLAAAALEATNPPLNAARLDIMPARMWGRAEGIRTLLKTGSQALAPVLFGVVADAFGSGSGTGTGTGAGRPGGGSGAALHGQGLALAFLIMLVPLAASAWIVLRARRSYGEDVASALSAEQKQTGAAGAELSRGA
jgi:predicted MFS family arabinose efflux permease